MVLKNVLIIFCFIFSSSINAQKFELGKVTIEELQEKVHPIDPSAEAAILYEKGKVSFDYTQDKGFFMNTEVEIRIKIYKKEGYDWANKTIQYYVENNETREILNFSNAITYNLIDGKIVKSKLKSDGEFDEKINKYWSRKKITMPNVKEGSVLEFKYIIESPNISRLVNWNFQTSIPVNHSEFITYVPEYFTYNGYQKGYIQPKVIIEKKGRIINYTYREKTDQNNIGDIKTASQEKLEFTETKTIFLAENFPAMKEESYVNNVNNYSSSISHELSMTSYPNTPLKLYSTDWDAVTQTIYQNESFGSELNKTGYFEEDIDALIKGVTDRDEKIAVIFNFVKSKVKWNESNSYYCENGVKKAYKDKVGNVAEINLMLTAMLRYANISANPVLISTRSNGISLFPNRHAYNYVISAVEIENGLILLDATEKFSTPNVLPLRDLNWFGRLIRKNGSSAEVNLFSEIVSRKDVNLSVVLGTDDIITGQIRSQLSEHRALIFRQKNYTLSDDAYIEKLESENNNIEISNYLREKEKDYTQPIVETYSFKDNKNIEKIGDKIYISPLLFLTVSENPFKQEKREYPIDFGYPTQDKYKIIIEIPESYVVESLPTAINLITGDDNIGSFKYMIVNNGNKIQIVITNNINASIVPAEYYENIKGFFQKMIDKQNEKIVLKKV